MITVWKFPLVYADRQMIEAPQDVQWLMFEEQNGTPCLWGQVDTELPLKPIEIRVAGTGHPLDSPGAGGIDSCDLQYIGSCMAKGGLLVWHAYEILTE